MALVSITTPDLRAISQPAAIDPDISATLSDFLTYTEHLPSAVVRSMTLIETLNRKAASHQKQMHHLLTTYSILPTITNNPPDAVRMRRDISHAYEKLEECKRMSAAEAARIEDMVTKDARRLDIVSQKLHALPLPPSRDATPDALLPSTSPNLKRSQAQQSSDKRVAAHRTTTAPRVRNRDKLMVPGEVLPPPNPDSPSPSEPDDWASPPPPLSPQDRRRQKSVGRQKTPKAASTIKPPKPLKDKLQKTPRPRPPGTPGTNAHSAVAGISTSNAIMALTKPPADAKPGSKWLPWKRLTEFELAILRKRMKKNAAWKPSPAMRNRELKDRGRGIEAMNQAKADAEANGTPFLDEYDTEHWTDPTKTSVSGEQQAELNAMLGPEQDQPDGDEALINRGMRLNEAKKLKREMQKAEESAEALAQQQLMESNQKLLTPKNVENKQPKDPKPSTKLPDPASEKPANPSSISIPTSNPLTENNTSKKRKHDETTPPATLPAENPTDSPDISTVTRPAPERKKIKLNPPAPPPDPTPALLPQKSSTPAAPSPRLPTRPRSQRASVVREHTPAPNPATRATKTGPTITIKRPKAASAEPPARRSLRRGSNASLPGGGDKAQSPAPKAPPHQSAEPPGTRRRRRPAPGVVAAEGDGSAKVSIGKRSRPPAKKQAQQVKGGAAKKDEAAPEDPDADEVRYCLCNDVSYGTMIACENSPEEEITKKDNVKKTNTPPPHGFWCDKEWFHLECVKLTDMPPRRAKWYCPECRRKLKLGNLTNGIVPTR